MTDLIYNQDASFTPPSPGMMQTFGMGFQMGLEGTSLGALDRAMGISDRFDNFSRETLSWEDYQQMGMASTGVQWSPGITRGDLDVALAARDRSQRFSQALQNSTANTIAGIGGSLVGGVFDPINLIPAIGLYSRVNSVGRVIASFAATNALLEVGVQGIEMQARQREQMEYGWDDFGMALGMAAVIGGALGGGLAWWRGTNVVQPRNPDSGRWEPSIPAEQARVMQQYDPDLTFSRERFRVFTPQRLRDPATRLEDTTNRGVDSITERVRDGVERTADFESRLRSLDPDRPQDVVAARELGFETREQLTAAREVLEQMNGAAQSATTRQFADLLDSNASISDAQARIALQQQNAASFEPNRLPPTEAPLEGVPTRDASGRVREIPVERFVRNEIRNSSDPQDILNALRQLNPVQRDYALARLLDDGAVSKAADALGVQGTTPAQQAQNISRALDSEMGVGGNNFSAPSFGDRLDAAQQQAQQARWDQARNLTSEDMRVQAEMVSAGLEPVTDGAQLIAAMRRKFGRDEFDAIYANMREQFDEVMALDARLISEILESVRDGSRNSSLPRELQQQVNELVADLRIQFDTRGMSLDQAALDMRAGLSTSESLPLNRTLEAFRVETLNESSLRLHQQVQDYRGINKIMAAMENTALGKDAASRLENLMLAGVTGNRSVENHGRAIALRQWGQQILGTLTDTFGTNIQRLIKDTDDRALFRALQDVTNGSASKSREHVIARAMLDGLESARQERASAGLREGINPTSLTPTLNSTIAKQLGEVKFSNRFLQSVDVKSMGGEANARDVAGKIYNELVNNPTFGARWGEAMPEGWRWNNSEQASDFRDTFSNQNVWQMVFEQIETLAKKQSAAELLGPSYQMNVERVLRDRNIEPKDIMRDLREATENSRYNALSTNNGVQITRNLQAAANSGAQPLVNMLYDAPAMIVSLNRILDSGGFGSTWRALTGTFSKSNREAMETMGVMADGIVNISSRFDVGNIPLNSSKTTEVTNTIARGVLNLSGGNLATNQMRAGSAQALLYNLARRSNQSYGSLSNQFRSNLQRFDIDEAAWSQAQNYTRNGLLDVSAMPRELGDRFRNFVTDGVDVMIATPSARDTRWSLLNIEANSPTAKAIHSFNGMLNASAAVVRKQMLRAAMDDTRGVASRVGDVAALAMIGGAAGMVAVNTREWLKGNKPLRWDSGQLFYNGIMASGMGRLSTDIAGGAAMPIINGVIREGLGESGWTKNLNPSDRTFALNSNNSVLNNLFAIASGEDRRQAGVARTFLESLPGQNLWYAQGLYRGIVVNNTLEWIDPRGQRNREYQQIMNWQNRQNSFFNSDPVYNNAAEITPLNFTR